MRKLIEQSQAMLNRSHNGIMSAAGVITVASLSSALMGLWRNRLLVSEFFGTPLLQSQLDAYWVAFRLPELAFQLLVIGSISAAFIPVYSRLFEKGRDQALEMVNSVMNLVLLVYVLVSIVIFVFAPQLIGLMTSEQFTDSQISLAAELTRVMLLSQLFFGVSNFMTGMLQAHRKFLIPALAPIAYNLGIILGIVLLTEWLGIYGPAVGVVLGALLHMAMQVPLALKLGYRYRPVLAWRSEGVQQMLTLMPPRALAISVNQLELFASVFFATALSHGSLTIINLAQQLMSAPNRIFSVPLGQASLPFLSKQVAANNMAGFAKTLIDTLLHVFFLALPATMLLVILRIPLVRLAYGSAEFPWTATLLTGRAVAIMAMALFAQGAVHLLARAFYALHNTTVPLVGAVLSVTVNIGLSYLTVTRTEWGVLGLAMALSAGSLIQFGFLLGWLIVRVKALTMHQLMAPLTKMLLASSVMAVALWLPMRLLDQFVFDTTRTVPLILLTVIASLVGCGVYLSLAAALSIDQYQAYWRFFRQLTKKSVLNWPSDELVDTTSQTQEIKPL